MSHEYEHDNTTVEVLAPHGLGFGHGSISVKRQLDSGELTPETLTAGADIIMHDPEIFVPVDNDAHDDGCGDGRPAQKIFQLIDSATGAIKEFRKSRRRAKLFGGGLVVASSMWRAIAGRPANGETVLGDRRFMADELGGRGIEFGGHTDNHAAGENCGCGAIDKYDQVSQSVNQYRNDIRGVLVALYGDEWAVNEAAVDEVFAHYAQLAGDNEYFANGSGAETKELLLESGAVVKELADDHLEDFIVLNDIEGTTFDQQMLDEKLRHAGATGTAQAFVVDTWRGRMYADAVAEIAAEHLSGIDVGAARQKAYADFLIRTLATAGTLTAGDIQVIGRRSEAKAHYALAA